MGNRVRVVEPFKSKYKVERSAYRLEDDLNVVHLRMLSPDDGKTHIEYFSYTIQRGLNVMTSKIEYDVLLGMQNKMDWALQKKRVENLKYSADALSEMHQEMMRIQLAIRCKINAL